MSNLIQVGEFYVDSELKNKLSKLSIQEYNELEESLKETGLIDPLRYFELDGKKIIVDGHNRLEICTKHNIPIKSVKLNFEGKTLEEKREYIEFWMLSNQIGRRNLSLFEKIEYALENEKSTIKLAPKEIKKTNDKLAYVLNIQYRSILLVRKILKLKLGASKHLDKDLNTPDLKNELDDSRINLIIQKLKEDKISIKEAYKEIFKKEKITQNHIEENNLSKIKEETLDLKSLDSKIKDQSISLIESYNLSKTIQLYSYNNSFMLKQNDLKVSIDLPTLLKYKKDLDDSKKYDSIKHESIILSSGLISSIIEDINNFINQK
jgi:ParB-like chromosome segregation protein Spo0J